MTSPDAPVGVRFVEVSADHDGQRIDNFLLRILKGVPKSLVYRCLRKGEVRVNKGRSRPDHRLHAGDVVRIPPLRVSADDNVERTVPYALAERLEAAVLYEDRDVLALDKPAGIAVHKGSGVHFGVIEALRMTRPEGFLELAHRLDRDTSGVLLLAKSATALRAIHDALLSRSSTKRYLAFVRGQWARGTCVVDAPLRKGIVRGGERMVEVAEDGKPSLSRFRPIQQYRHGALLEVEIDTGRTHQIRVHAAHLGHPLAGDDKYGDAAFNRVLAGYGCRRLFLHAQYLSLPLGGRDLDLSAPLAPELAALLDALGGGA